MAKSRLSERNRAEIARSASQALKLVVKPVSRANIDRYLNASADTPYGLEYAFHLLGDVRDKTVVDLGCGIGDCILPLLELGAHVIAIDISPELIAIAQQRIAGANYEATLMVGSAYETGLPDESVDVIFCMALIHHLDIELVRGEMWRILRKGGMVILKEPIRFSRVYAWLRGLLPAKDDISDFEHPLAREELAAMIGPFKVEGMRYFRLPFVPLVSRAVPSMSNATCKASNWILQHWPITARYATGVTARLQKVA